MPVATAMLTSCAWTAYLVARRAVGVAPTHVRAAATALVALWLSVAVFAVLAALRFEDHEIFDQVEANKHPVDVVRVMQERARADGVLEEVKR